MAIVSERLACVGGLLWYPGDSDEASLNPALNAAMLLARYAPIASTDDKRTTYLVRALMNTSLWWLSQCCL